MSNISMSLAGMLYNIQLSKLANKNGVAAYDVLKYLNFIFMTIFLGYTIGIAPIVSYHFGARNSNELKNLLKKSLITIAFCSITMFCFSELLALPLSKLFVGYKKYYMSLCLGDLEFAHFYFCLWV